MHRKNTTAEDGMQTGRSVSHSGKTLRWYLSIRPVAVLAAAAAALLTTGLVAGPLADGMAGAATSHATSHALATSGLGYTPLAAPVRIADTRAGATDPATYAGKTLAQGTSLTVDVPSTDVPASAGAVVVNITAVNPSNSGFLSVYPGGGTNPGTANVTFATGQDVGDQVTVGLGPDAATASTQSFTVYDGPTTGGATVDFTADLVGYYASTTAATGDAYNGLTPARILDTRTGSGAPGAGSTLTNGGSINVPVVGVGGVPASASAVALNVAVTNTTAPSFITAFPTGQPQPGTASQNFVAGETLSSQVVAGVGTGGDVTIANHAGNADIVVDVDGYFTAPNGAGSLLTVLSQPVRLDDTRPGGVAGGASTTAIVQGAGATAGVLSVADITTPGDGNFLTAYPTGGATPLAATVNYVPGDSYNVVENAAYATTGTGGSVSVLNGPASAAKANVVVDEDGYFTPSSSSGVTVSATPSSIPADGVSTSKVTVTVNGASGVVANDPVALVVTPSATCGTVSPTSGTTNASGQVTSTYTASTTAGTCTVKATEANFDTSGSTTITQTGVSKVAVTAGTNPMLANGVATSLITATVTGALAAPIPADTVTFAISGGTSCGTLNPTSGTTNASGVATSSYTASTTAGFCTVTATESLLMGTGSVVIDQESSPAIAAVTVSIAANPSSLAANGSSTSAITGSVLQTVGSAPVPGDQVEFAVSPTTCGTVTPAIATTNASGAYTAIYKASTTVTSCSITATEADNGTASTPVHITQTAAPNNVLVTSSAPSVTENTGTATITVTVTTPEGAPVPAGDVLNMTVAPGLGCGIFSSNQVTTGAGGIATVTYTAGTGSEFCTITATENASPPPPDGTGSVVVDQTLPIV